MPPAGRAARLGDRPAAASDVLVVDVRPHGPEPLLVAAGSGGVTYRCDLPAAQDVPDETLVVGLRCVADDAWATTFAAWALQSGVALLEVAVGSSSAVVGPLNVPGRVGCGHCARERMRAAAAVSGRLDVGAHGAPSIDSHVGAAVTHSLRAIHDGGALASDLVDHVLVLTAGSSTRHRFVALASCRVCGGAAARTRQAQRVGGPRVDPLAGWVDPVTGVIPALTVDRDEPLPAVAIAATPHVVGPDGSLRRLPGGWGKGLTSSHAVLSAIGEAIERYSASVADPARVLWRRPDQLDGEHIDPRLLARYSEAQYEDAAFPYARFDPGVPHPWVRGHWLHSHRQVWVPAVATFLSLTLTAENVICQGTSNGLAASTGADDAALRATLELVERDAMMAAWMSGRGATRVTLDDTLEAPVAAVVGEIACRGGTVELYVLPDAACGVAVLCLALGNGRDWPGATIGMSADLDPLAAVRQAILEVGQTGPYLAARMQDGEMRVPRDVTQVRDMRDHAAYYFPAERAVAFDGLRAGRETVSLASLAGRWQPRSLEACRAGLAAAGVRVAIVDVTSADVATGPFRVARAVSPDLQPISYGYGLDRGAVPRILARGLAADAPPIHPIS